jgi:replicative DNA helicase
MPETKQNKEPVPPKIPHNLDAERSVLGAILVNNSHLDVAAEIIRPDDFFLNPHGRIFSTYLLMQADNDKIDLVSLSERLSQLNVLEAVGGQAYISALMDGVPHVVNIGHHAKIIKQKSQLRSVIRTSDAFEQKAFKSGDPKEIVDDIEKFLQGFYDQEESDAAAPVSMPDAVKELSPVLERAFNAEPGKHAMMGTPTGYRDLDNVLAGWIPGDLVILGARPSTGKTALTLEFLRKQAKEGNGVLYFSLEMSRVSLMTRLCCLEAGVDGHKLRTGNTDREERSKLIAAMNTIANWPIWISEPSRMWSYDLIRRVRSFSARRPIKVVMVDYLQLLKARAENRQQEVGKIAQDLKEAARILGKQCGGTVIATAQLSRLGADERPRLDHLRESGELEQAADVVLFLWNADDVEPGEKHPYRKMVGVGKQRNGPLSVMRMVFESTTNEFHTASDDEWKYLGEMHQPKEGEEKKGRKRREKDDD